MYKILRNLKNSLTNFFSMIFYFGNRLNSKEDELSQGKYKFSFPALISTDSRVSVGCFTYGSPRLMLWQEDERISIGKYCSIAEKVTIFGGGEHRSDWVTTFPIRKAFNLDRAGKDGHPTTKGPTVIGNDVWLGYGSTVLSGIK